MYDQQVRAAKLIAVGDSIEAVAKAVGKEVRTVKLWFLDEDFRRLVLKDAGSGAVRILVGYISGENDDRSRAMMALALLRMNKTPTPRDGSGPKPLGEEDTDLDEFSEAQLRRLAGDG